MRGMDITRTRRVLVALGLPLLAMVLLACVTLPWELLEGTATGSIPQWTCPTNTPVPYGTAGPVKSTRTISEGGQLREERTYYQIWEQEYGSLGDPAPAPTPYTRIGGPFLLGQLVNASASLDLRATVTRTEVLTGSRRLYLVQLDAYNRGAPLPFTPARQVVITSIRAPGGRQLAGDGWGWSQDAAQLAQLPTDDLVVTLGGSEALSTTLSVPILAPDGTVEQLAVRLDLADSGGGGSNDGSNDPAGDGTPTPEAVLAGLPLIFQAGHEPHCGADGTLAAVYSGTPVAAAGPPPPANAPDVVAWALSQVGRPYCWGGKGNVACFGNPDIPAKYGGPYADRCPDRQGLPCWDCSGLTEAAYRAVAHVEIGAGTANQQHLPAVWRVGDGRDPQTVAQPGDLLLFRGERGPGIVHVGMYMGENRMVHAAYFPAGVLVTPRVFASPYYRPVLVLIVRPDARGRG